MLSILTQFLSNRSHHVMVDGCGSKLFDVVSGVPQGSVLGTLLLGTNLHLLKVSEWCYLLGIKLNASNTKTMIDSRSRTMFSQSPALTIGGTVLKESDDLVILGVCIYYTSSLCFQSSFSTAWYLEAVLAIIP